ncbi:ANTAR domain-containing protein [Vibrio aquaticus]|uniref:ANTAR domain-containing protein n=1 Tax=Vibrio aquaticus TaxID=2496559 RepID=A0A432D2Z6_9VIBR|nr:ANTAR domain-containing protein [Vibrio aquaticus]RTZ18302.1 ANTAR domain-containing protein [Vibrio aquaticus]
MQKILSKTPIIICCDRIEEQVRLTTLLAPDCDNILTCQLNHLESMLQREPSAHVVIGWLQPSAELRLIIEACRANSHPLLVVVKQLNSNDINRLPERMDYVLVPADSELSLAPWLLHASQINQSVTNYEQEINRLSTQLEERKVIEKAKGLLMTLHQVDEEGAYQAMRTSAMKSSQPLVQVARNLLQTLEALK